MVAPACSTTHGQGEPGCSLTAPLVAVKLVIVPLLGVPYPFHGGSQHRVMSCPARFSDLPGTGLPQAEGTGGQTLFGGQAAIRPGTPTGTELPLGSPGITIEASTSEFDHAHPVASRTHRCGHARQRAARMGR